MVRFITDVEDGKVVVVVFDEVKSANGDDCVVSESDITADCEAFYRSSERVYGVAEVTEDLGIEFVEAFGKSVGYDMGQFGAVVVDGSGDDVAYFKKGG